MNMDTFVLSIVKEFLKARWFQKLPRSRIRALHQRSLDQTLLHAWDHSKFYRKLWEEAGIKREELAGITLERLPIVNKRQLMGAFGDVVTIPHVSQNQVEQFIQHDPTGKEWFQGRYVAMNTSGSSGVVGIFLYTKQFWARLMGVVAARIIQLPTWYFAAGKVRLGFVGETSGHHAGISLIKAAPGFLHAQSVDVDSSKEKLKTLLEKHRPNVLAGYASGVALLAEMAERGEVSIQPRVIVCSGEVLSTAREEVITKAFKVRPINFYGATECLAMGASLYESGTLDIFDDLLHIEAVDDAGKQVADGTLGRVVITVLKNDAFPLIRYAIDDEIALAKDDEAHPFTRATEIAGRKMDRLTLTLRDGRSFIVHPMDMVGFFFPGLKQYQVVQTGSRDIAVHAVFEGDQDVARRQGYTLIDQMLNDVGLSRDDINVTVEFVDAIHADPKTGKTPIVVPLRQPVPETPSAS